MGPDVLFKVTGFLICTVTIVALVGSVCFVYKTIIKITLKKLVPWDGLDKTNVSDEDGFLQWDGRHWGAALAHTDLGRFPLVPQLPKLCVPKVGSNVSLPVS